MLRPDVFIGVRQSRAVVYRLRRPRYRMLMGYSAGNRVNRYFHFIRYSAFHMESRFFTADRRVGINVNLAEPERFGRGFGGR